MDINAYALDCAIKNIFSKLILSTYLVVLWISEIPNLKEFFLYVPWEISCLSFKLTNESASFTQSANGSTLVESVTGCDWLLV